MRVTKKTSGPNYASLLATIADVHGACQIHAAAAVNQALTFRNWLIGAYIVEYEQRGSDRATYGEHLLERLAADCQRLYRTGYSLRNFKLWRKLYLAYPIGQTPSAQSSRVDLRGILQTVSAKLVNTREIPGLLDLINKGTGLVEKGQTPSNLLPQHQQNIGLEPAVLFSTDYRRGLTRDHPGGKESERATRPIYPL